MKSLGCTVGIVVSALALACSGGTPAPGEENVGSTSSIKLALGTTAASGAHYRLSPASFTINGGEFPPDYSVDAAPGQDNLLVPVSQYGGSYRVRLDSGWQMQRVASDGTLSPVPATLLSQQEQFVFVQAFEATPVLYDFQLGVSALDIGISVNEGIQPGYDGKIFSTLYGQYYIAWQGGGSDCCYETVSAALAAFPDKQIQEP
jgi:hypothetical protein